ncbi:L,D-transpeptidase family protein [Leisingera sp. S132]|uniref:L,D-transpeptidase family protein n=1 Tax=Leisingera sp. S132 TaxID=2867016 RepID=UPI0021A36881|nr:L,D-transpeptidase family protein [Leisingera sp. S132]UWQ79120.1 L,D-transpeptidase family protein [Leisingera sp. S132]
MTPSDLVLTPAGVRFMGRALPCTIGKGGLSDRKREGDGATPIGTHRVAGMLYRPDRLPPPAPWAKPIGPNDLWSDDVRDDCYNLQVRAPYAFSHEKLRRSDPLYDLVLITDWNWPDAIPGKGSAIFIHQWRRPGYPTEGCIAFSRANLHWLAARVQIGTRIIVPDLPAA